MADEQTPEFVKVSLQHDIYVRLMETCAQRAITPLKWLEDELTEFEKTRDDNRRPNDDGA